MRRSAIAPVQPRPGARERVRAAIDLRIALRRRRRLVVHRGAIALVGMAALVLVMVAFRRPSSVTTNRSSVATGSILELSVGARLLVRTGSDVTLARADANETAVRLRTGQLLAQVAKQPPGRTFVVLAGDVRVEVVGTRYAVAVDGNAVSVRVFEGAVRVVTPTTHTLVGAGDSWPPQSPAIEVEPAELDRLARRIPEGPIVEPLPAPGPAEVLPARAPATHRPLSDFATALRMEQAGDVEGAVVIYARIADRQGEQAEDASYALGRLYQRRLDDATRAQATFESYRKRYPEGRYARAVDVAMLDLALDRHDIAAIRRECDRFLAEHPDDPRAARFRLARAAAR